MEVHVAAHAFGYVLRQRHVGSRIEIDLLRGARELFANGFEVGLLAGRRARLSNVPRH